MQNKTHPERSSPGQARVHDRGVPREDERILATVPARTRSETNGRGRPDPEIYRHALKAILATPEIESRLGYITASFIVTVFGGWLAAEAVKARAFILFIDILLFIFSVALAGFLVGVMLGQAILPPATAPILLAAAAVIAVLLAGIVLAHMVIGAIKEANSQSNHSSIKSPTVPVSRQDSYPGRSKTG